MIVFCHIKKTENIGDKVCTPALYFNFDGSQIFNHTDVLPPCDVAIFGGGAIEWKLRGDNALQRQVQAKRRIAWAVGASERGSDQHPPPPTGFDLIGVREFGRKGAEYVPCVTAMSKLLDEQYPIAHDFVLFVNFDKKLVEPNIPGIPKLYNNRSLTETIRFLASGETVITNSYHGAYWATLLGRKVICLPYSSKFYGFKYPPVMARDDDWRAKANDAVSYPEALADCRKANLAFCEKVRDVINEAAHASCAAPT